MSNFRTDDELRRDGVIGNAQEPLPEPWFIREVRGPNPPPRRAAEPVPMRLPPVAARADDGPLPDDPVPAGARPWRKLAIAASIIAVAIIAWLALMPKQGGAPPVAALEEDGATVAAPAPAPLDCASPAAVARLRDVLIGQARQNGARDADPEGRAAGLSVGTATAAGPPTGDGRTLACRGVLSLAATSDAAPVAAQVDYRIRPAANGAVEVTGVTGAAAIVAALGQPSFAAVPPADEAEAFATEAAEVPDVPPPPPEVRAPAAPPEVRAPAAPPEVRAPAAPPEVRAPAAPLEPEPVAEVSSPSFDCRRVTSRVLKAVCASPKLAALDVEMSELFFDVRGASDFDGRADLEASREEYIARRQSCRDDACIARVYREQIIELETWR